MATSRAIIKQCQVSLKKCGPLRQISTSSSPKRSTSPQRQPVASTKPATRVKSFHDIPGPLALPMLRHSAHVLPRIGCFHHVVGLGLLEGLQRRYGDLVRLAKGSRKRPVLYVFDPEIMKQIYESKTTEAPEWSNSPLLQQRTRKTNSCPVHGDESKAIWTALRTLLLDKAVTHNYEKIFDDISVDLCNRLEALRNVENTLNEELEAEIYRWSLETMGSLIFGIRLGCMDGDVPATTSINKIHNTSLDDEISEDCSLHRKPVEDLTLAEQLIINSKEIAKNNFMMRTEQTLRPDSEVFNNALKAFDVQYGIIEKYLEMGLANLKNGKSKAESTFLQKIGPLQHKLLPIASDLMLAGVEPLAQTAIAMLYHLSLHAAQQQRAQDEVAWATVAVDEGAEYPELPYVCASVREALRLHPVTGGVVRRNKEQIIVAGYEIPPGVDIVLAHGFTSKLEKEWGRANAFIPDRWCPEGWEPLKAARAHPFSSRPFGENCPAEEIAVKMLTSLATRILEKYRLEWQAVTQDTVLSSVNKLKRPYYFVLQKSK